MPAKSDVRLSRTWRALTLIPNRTTRDPSVTLWRACDFRQVFDLTHVYDAFTPHNIGQYESRFLSFGITLVGLEVLLGGLDYFRRSLLC